MHKFKLNLNNQELENIYKQSYYSQERPTLIILLFFVSVVLFMLIIQSAIWDFSLNLPLMASLILIIFAQITMISKQKNIDKGPLFIQIVIIGIIIYLTSSANTDQNFINSFSLGYFVAFIQKYYCIGTNYIHKTLPNIVIFISSTMLIAFIYQRFDSSIYLPFINIFEVFLIYVREKKNKEQFLQNQQLIRWQQAQDQLTQLSIIDCYFEENFKQISLQRSNYNADLQLGIKNQQTFRNFIRLAYQVKNNTMKKLGKVGNQEFTIETLLYHIFVGKQNRQQSSSIESEQVMDKFFKFTVFYQKDYYHVCVLLNIDGSNRLSLFLEKQGTNDADKIYLNSQLKQTQNMLKVQQTRVKQIARANIIQITSNLSQTNNQILQLTNTLQLSMNLSYIQMNSIFNFELFSNSEFKINIQELNLKNLVNKIISIFQQFGERKKLLFLNSIPDTQIYQDKFFLSLIVFNIINNIVQYSSKSTKVIIQLLCENDIFCLVFQNKPKTNITDETIKQLPVLFPFLQEDIERNIQNQKVSKQFQQNLSFNQVCLIGPYDKIFLVRKQQNYLATKIYFFNDLRKLQTNSQYRFCRLPEEKIIFQDSA